MNIINNNPNVEDTINEKKVWCTFQNSNYCISINEDTIVNCFNLLKKKYLNFNIKTIDCVDVIIRDLKSRSGHNDEEFLALDFNTFNNYIKSKKGGK